MAMSSLGLALFAGLAYWGADGDTIPSNAPVVRLTNGSYYGLHNSRYYQDEFLGMPYAQPPVGDLRYRPPVGLNSTWPGLRNATEYGYACLGYGDDTENSAGNYTNEDCLTLNVVRPSGHMGGPLPVAVWIHGGGYFAGSARNPQYNLSYLVEQSVVIGQPIIAVSIQYRLAGLGYLWSDELVAEGAANLGTRDYYQSLRWVHENIQAFGGDPKRVSIFGESAGGRGIGDQLLAYNGRNDKLFSAAIAQSGAPTGFGAMDPDPEVAKKAFRNITESAGCGTSTDKVACLRKTPIELLNNAINASLQIRIGEGLGNGFSLLVFGPLPDGDIVAQDPVTQMAQGRFAKVPFMIGDTNDEGTSFIPWGLNTDEDVAAYLSYLGYSRSETREIMEAYPFTGLPDADQVTTEQIGRQFKRVSTMMTDIMMKAPRRMTLGYWTRAAAKDSAPVYIFNLNASLAGSPAFWGSTHGDDTPYVFHNLVGSGYDNHSAPWYGPNPFDGRPQGYLDLADTICRAWISFFNTHNPNYPKQIIPTWPAYNETHPLVIDFKGAGPSVLLEDTYRKHSMDLLNEMVLNRMQIRV